MMKLLTVTALCIISTAYGYWINDATRSIYYNKACLKPMILQQREIHFYYYSHNHAKVKLTSHNLNIININNPVKFLIHGYLENVTIPWVNNMTSTYLRGQQDYNIIVVDWSSIAMNKTYSYSAYFTRYVGKVLAKFLMVLYQNRGISFQKIHLIGFSLGAHVAGFAGKHIKYQNKGRIARITGLDPAANCFQIGANRLVSEDNRLCDKDAKIVDIAHTDAGYIGIAISENVPQIGTADFYINGGISNQPGCGDINVVFTTFLKLEQFVKCHIYSHIKSTAYFTESIYNNKMIAKGRNSGFAIFGEHIGKVTRGKYDLIY